MTTTMTIEEKAIILLKLKGFEGRNQKHRIANLANVLIDHPNAWIETCSDVRFGNALCEKIGHTIHSYQLWACWN